MSSAILYSEVSLVCILFLTMLVIRIKKSMFLQEQRQMLVIVAVSNILLFFTDAVWIFVDNGELAVSVTGNWILNSAYYILGGLLGYLWFCYSETVHQSRFVRDKRYRLAALVPAAALVVLTLLSVKTGLLFYIDAQNAYHRGPLYAIQIILSYSYVITASVRAFCLSFKTEDYGRRRTLRTLASFVLPCIIAGALQVFFPGYPILCVGNTVGILYVYLNMQEQLISVDTLTGLNNRNRLHQYLSAAFEHPDEVESLYLLMMDVDKFKSINDHYGHVEGDRALKLVADSLKRVCHQKNFFIARFGGDEFIVLCELGPEGSVDTVCERIHAELRTAKVPYSLTVSIGCAKFNKDIKTQQEFIALSDGELYKAKQLRDEKRR